MPVDSTPEAAVISDDFCVATDRVVRARSLVGVRFRLHGRDPAYGLDCVGVVAWTCKIKDVPSGYTLGSVEVDWALAMLARCGFVPVDGGAPQAEQIKPCPAGGPRSVAIRPGDVLLIRCGARQIHLAVATGAGAVHACAWLRRVVEGPLPHEWEVLAVLRPPPVPPIANPVIA